MNCYFLDSTAFAKLFVEEEGTTAVIQLMESVEDNRKLLCASTPVEVYAALLQQERGGRLSHEDGERARAILRTEAARMVQQPLNAAALEAARQLLDRYPLRSSEALQLGSALVAREMFHGMEIIFVSAQSRLLEAAAAEHFQTLNPSLDSAQPGSTVS